MMTLQRLGEKFSDCTEIVLGLDSRQGLFKERRDYMPFGLTTDTS